MHTEKLAAAYREHRAARAIHWTAYAVSLAYLAVAITPSLNRDMAFTAISATFMISSFATHEYHSRRVAAIKQGGEQ